MAAIDGTTDTASGDPSHLGRLNDLDEYKVADGYPDIRGWDVRTTDNTALSRYAAGAVVNGSLKPYPGQWSPVKSTRDAADSTAASSPVRG